MSATGPSYVAELTGPRLSLTVSAFFSIFRCDSSHLSSRRSDYSDSLLPLPIETTKHFEFVQRSPSSRAASLRQRSCTRLLTQMPALESIAIDSLVAPPFFHALEPVGRELLCPRLRQLVFIRRSNDEEIPWGRLLALSNQRGDHGCPLMYSVKPYSSSDWRKIDFS
jgi:hypothetical protein